MPLFSAYKRRSPEEKWKLVGGDYQDGISPCNLVRAHLNIDRGLGHDSVEAVVLSSAEGLELPEELEDEFVAACKLRGIYGPEDDRLIPLKHGDMAMIELREVVS